MALATGDAMLTSPRQSRRLAPYRSQHDRPASWMGVPHLFQADLVKFRIPLPPLDEQKAISSFLDVETSKIDGLVSEQRRLIELKYFGIARRR
jgi:hypothetical protein